VFDSFYLSFVTVLQSVYNVILMNVYIFHFGNKVASRKPGVTHSHTHPHAQY